MLRNVKRTHYKIYTDIRGGGISVFSAKEAHKPPVFIEKLQNTGVAERFPVRLECRVSGVPPPQIFWKKENESLIYNTDRVRLVSYSIY